MTHLILHYLHRDEGNWKDYFEACIQNPTGCTAQQAEGMIRECLIDGEYFYPQKVGLPFLSPPIGMNSIVWKPIPKGALFLS